jgi:drug/metabolite transporter (DMT)-like permease
MAGSSLLMVIVIGVLWGLNWPAVKFMLTEMPPLTIRALAFPLAAILLAVIAKGMGRSLRPAREDYLPIAITGLFLVFGFNILTSFGQLVTETSRATIIAYTMPALTALLAVIFLNERPGARLVLALVLGMAALLVLASEDFAALAAEPLGPALMLGAALSWALGNVALKARRWSLPPLSLTVWFFVVASVLAWPLVCAFEPPWRQSPPSWPILLTLTYHVLGPMVVCYALWTIVLGRLSATVASISVLTAPIVGVSSAMILLGEPSTWQKVLSLLMVVTSISVTLMPRADRGRRQVQS